MIAKDGNIGNARSEDGDRSLLQVKGERRKACFWEEYSSGFRSRPGGLGI